MKWNPSKLRLRKMLTGAMALFFVAGLSSCTWKSEKDALAQELEELKMENQKLQNYAGERDSAIVDFIRAYDEIDQSIQQIKESEKSLKKAGNTAEGKAVQERIIDDFKQINTLISDNKERIQKLNSKIEGLTGQNKELSNLIRLLKEELTERVEEVEGLKEELMVAYEAFDALNDIYVESVGVIEEQENELNTAFYAVGSFKELKENGVVDREDGLSGLVGAKELSEDLNTNYFKKVDKRLIQRIETFAKKAKLVTNHPAKSYEIVLEENNAVLVIKDPEAFWSITKYLVIMVG